MDPDPEDPKTATLLFWNLYSCLKEKFVELLVYSSAYRSLHPFRLHLKVFVPFKTIEIHCIAEDPDQVSLSDNIITINPGAYRLLVAVHFIT